MAETRTELEPHIHECSHETTDPHVCRCTICGKHIGLAETRGSEPSQPEFYEANATNVCNVPRVGHPEDPSGWAGVRRASEARFVAGDALVMTLADAFDFAEKYKAWPTTKTPR